MQYAPMIFMNYCHFTGAETGGFCYSWRTATFKGPGVDRGVSTVGAHCDAMHNQGYIPAYQLRW